MKNYSRAVLIVAAFLAVAAGSLIGALTGQGQTKKLATENDKPTPVIEGVVTRRQIEHSKLYAQAGRRKNISDSPDGTKLIIGLPWHDVSANRNATFETYLEDLTCQADAVVVGSVKGKESQLTTDGSFIFTDYELAVEDVIKPNRVNYLDPTSEITVTRPGGTINLNSRTIAVLDRSFKPLRIGKKYFLFLTYLPATGAYKSLNGDSSFEINDGRLSKLTDLQSSYRLPQDKDASTVINSVRTPAINC